MNLVEGCSYYEQLNYQKAQKAIMPKFIMVILILIALLIWIPLAILISSIQKLYIVSLVLFRKKPLKQVNNPN